MNKPIIAAEHWRTYRACQELGYENMCDYNAWQKMWELPKIEWPFLKLTKEEWFEIIRNYSYYKKKYEDSIKNRINNDANLGGF